ncbi:MAG: hemerythrin domain-containing protein [Neisseria sp.]|nr:hemerythrin domain-containing protein [Neisseria sp.]
MKRHEQLITFSREHHSALVLAKRIIQAPQDDHAAAMHKEAAALLEHFAAEETQFAPYWPRLPEVLRITFEEQHQNLRALIAAAERHEQQLIFAQALREHVRFEERELFPALEALF